MRNILNRLMVFLIISSLSFSLQAATPSPSMIAQISKLPKSEQAKLARQYGIKLSDIKNTQAEKKNKTGSVESKEDQSEFKDDTLFEKSEKKSDDGTPERFGLSFFERARDYDIQESVGPVPDQYKLGPDDELKLQVYGNEHIEEELIVSRDGSVSISEIGVVYVAGLTFQEAREAITEKIQAAHAGSEVSLSVGRLRTISVIVAGEAKLPGSYKIPALSSVVDALMVAGGVSDIGSLRKIQIKHKDGSSHTVDLYRLLLGGDSGVDVQLLNGDVVFVAPYDSLVEVSGEVLRPALYETQQDETVSQLLQMAGGGKASAYIGTVILERIDRNSVRDLKTLDLSSAVDMKISIQNGDVLRVGKVSSTVKNKVEVLGAVARPGVYAHREGMKVTDILSSLWEDLTINTDLDYALVVSRQPSSNKISVQQFNLGVAIDQPGSAEDIQLKPQDVIMVFSYDEPLLRHKVDEYLFKRYQKELMAAVKLNEIDLQEEQKPASNTAEMDSGEDKLIKPLITQADFTNQVFNLVLSEDAEKQIDHRLSPKLFEDEDRKNKTNYLPASHHKLVVKIMRELLSDVSRDQEILLLTAGMTRQELLYPLLNQLKTNSFGVSEYSIVYVSGEVREPGEYPLAAGANVERLVAAAGGLLPSAFLERAELTRANITDSGAIHVKHFDVSLFEELKGQSKTGLQSRDRLNIFRFTDWDVERKVVLAGQVRFPGEYSIRNGETLADILKRAGGLTSNAFAEGAVMIREQVKQQEVEQMNKLTQQLRRDIAARTLSAESNTLSTTDALVMLNEIEKVKPIGRLVVNVKNVIEGSEVDDLVLEGGDYLYIPTRKTTVSIVGEVQHPSSHRFKAGLSLEDYLRLAGGSRKRADEERVYIIRADGSVLVPQKDSWFAVSAEDIQPGDTIVMPLDTEFKDNMTLWTQVTQIFYQSAVALAAINSF